MNSCYLFEIDYAGCTFQMFLSITLNFIPVVLTQDRFQFSVIILPINSTEVVY